MAEGRRGSETSPVEWVIAAMSALLVLAMIAYLLYDELSGVDRPPRIAFTIDTIAPAGSSWVVQFRAHNTGELTAAALTVEGSLRRPGDTTTVESAEATIDYLPSEGTRRAGLFFAHDPRQYDLTLEPKGYALP